MSIQLAHTGKRFELHGTKFECSQVGFKAGFTKSESSGIWYTGKPQIAQAFLNQADIAAIRALAPFLERQMLSRKSDWGIQIEQMPKPAGLEFLPFQQAGIAYSADLIATLNADEMGLGKTLQGIGLINKNEPTRVAICCPAVAKIMWGRKLAEWLTVGRTIGIADTKELPRTDIVIFNYENAIRLADQLDEVDWDLLIFDEAHMLKNPNTQRTMALLGETQKGKRKTTKKSIPGLKGKQKLFLSGTPIETRPLDLWPIIRACDPDGLGSNRSWFETRYCAAEQGYFGWDNKGASNLPELNNYLRGTFMVRHLKKDVLSQLPPKRRQILAISAPGAVSSLIQKELYYYDSNQREIDRARAEAERYQLGDKASYAAAVAKLRSGRAALFEEMATLRKQTALAKIPVAIELIEDILANGEKLVVFGYHREVVNKIYEHFAKGPGIASIVDGSMTTEAKQAHVDNFQNNPNCRLIVGTIPTMYATYTLTAAQTCLFIELDWRNTVIKQAEDRIHRIGQAGSVLALHLVFDGSLDSRIAKQIVTQLDNEEAALD